VTAGVEILAEAARRGVILAVEGNRLNWKAPSRAMTSDLIETLRKNKKEIIELLRERDVLARQRWGCPPDGEISLSLPMPRLLDKDVELLVSHFAHQPNTVIQWICDQASRYDLAVPHWKPPAIREFAAALDCLLWQWEDILRPPEQASRYERVQQAIKKLKELDEIAQHFAQQWPAKTEGGQST
tara:strand:+ start:982 stop:1536 length:555 start_codon:yes stop_codon:yes gene_type:complete